VRRGYRRAREKDNYSSQLTLSKLEGGDKGDRSIIVRRGYRRAREKDNYSSQLTLSKLEALLMT